MPNTLHKPFGPLLMQTQLSDKVFDILLNKSKSTRYDANKDFRNKLAGNIAEEYKLEFDQEEKDLVYGELITLAQQYMSEAKKERRIKKFGRPRAKDVQILEPIWVNFMKEGEWNPAHFHAGCISCVMYLQVPKEIEDENTQSESSKNSNQPSAGRIQWTYGESIHFSESFFTQTPKEKDVWFFPADLKHFVYPFKSKVERISISCNFK